MISNGRILKHSWRRFWLLCPFIGLFFSQCSSPIEPIEKQKFNTGWCFFLGDTVNVQQPNFNDSNWRKLDVPHDWSIEGNFSPEFSTGFRQGALPAGIAWYRKVFETPQLADSGHLLIAFDGVSRFCQLWLNGQLVGKHQDAYTSFSFDLTPFLASEGKKNTLALRVDNSLQPSSRYYVGSGIYRNVYLIRTGSEQINRNTVQIQSVLTTNYLNAKIQIAFSLSAKNDQHTSVVMEIFSGKKRLDQTEISGDKKKKIIRGILSISEPELWSPEHPFLYSVRVTLNRDGQLQDELIIPFGIRTISADPHKGLLLNGKPYPVHGVCLHQDLGALGSVSNKQAQEHRLKMLKNMGCNAIRFAHNPPDPGYLDLCDSLGFLVMDEAFDVWKKKKVKYDEHINWEDQSTRTLTDMVRRDRNHPSIIYWSIGNEISEQFDSTGTSIARHLVSLVRNLDTTRLITSALTENHPDKNFIYQSNALDVLGFNYKSNDYDQLPKRFPNECMIATETASAFATRGRYLMPSDSIRHWPVRYGAKLEGVPGDYSTSAYDNTVAYWGTTHENSLLAVKSHPFLEGQFVWSGVDYLGEPDPYKWPAHSSFFGLIDLADFPKDTYFLYQSEWTDQPVLHLFPHWNWKSGQLIDVWAYYSQADELELFLNGQSLGKRSKLANHLHVSWKVQFVPGELRVVSRKNGKEMAEERIYTAKAPVRLRLVAEDDTLVTGNGQLDYLTLTAVDSAGHENPLANNAFTITSEGPVNVVGVANGYQASLDPMKGVRGHLYNGKCRIIVGAGSYPGTAYLKVRSDGLDDAKQILTILKGEK